jgi:DNA-directed RNA polymerase specialized sigma24 family protein
MTHLDDVAWLDHDDLVRRCAEETENFRWHRPADDRPTVELFRRAICVRDQRAWSALYRLYYRLVLSWIARHPARSSIQEDDDVLANGAFIRFWSSITPERFAAFPNTAALLRYLRMCCHSVVLDQVRAQRSVTTVPTFAQLAVATDPSDAVSSVLSALVEETLWHIVRAEATSREEDLLVQLCLRLDMKPREVQERHPDMYPTVEDVYRTKRNLLDRLFRNGTLRRLLVDNAAVLVGSSPSG